MNLYLLNSDLEKLANISAYTSLIWTRRYNEVGEFELYISVNSIDFTIFKQDQFIIRDDDETVMIVEKIRLPEDVENGDYLIVSGRSAESILERRCNQTRLFVGNYADLYDAIYPLLDKNILENAGVKRHIPIITCVQKSTLALESEVFISSDRFGDNLYESIRDTCKSVGWGFKFVIVNSNNVRTLCFNLYEGVDRSNRQSILPRVIFSNEFGNLLNSEYSLDFSSTKNSSLIAGEGEGIDRKIETIGNETGLKRREIYVDARDLSSTINDESGTQKQMTEEEYREALRQRGFEKLTEFKTVETFDFEIETVRLYQYKKDFIVGDIITGTNKYGISSNARIIEMNEIFDDKNYMATPKIEGVI